MKTIDGNALEKAVASYIFEDAKLSIPQLLKNGDLLMVCEIISHFPAVDAEPVKHGTWENSRPDAPMFGFYYCSLCGRKRTSPQDRYCPNCGARMDKE